MGSMHPYGAVYTWRLKIKGASHKNSPKIATCKHSLIALADITNVRSTQLFDIYIVKYPH